MDRDTIIRLAREAGFADGVVEIVGLEGFSRFAALVVANIPPQSWMSYQEGYEAGQQAGRLAERERIYEMLIKMHTQEERHNYYMFIANIIKESK